MHDGSIEIDGKVYRDLLAPDHGKARLNARRAAALGGTFDGQGRTVTELPDARSPQLVDAPVPIDDSLDALEDAIENPLSCEGDTCSRSCCNRVSPAMLQPDYSISKGGGGDKGPRKRKKTGLGDPVEPEHAQSANHNGWKAGRPIKGLERRITVNTSIGARTYNLLEYHGITLTRVVDEIAANPEVRAIVRELASRSKTVVAA